MEYFDRYMAEEIENIRMEQYNFYFIVCFMIACKFEELPAYKPPTLDKMNYYAMTEYTKRDYQEAERIVLQKLDYRLQTLSIYETTEELRQLAETRATRELTQKAAEKWRPSEEEIINYAAMKIQHIERYKDITTSHMVAAAIIAATWKKQEDKMTSDLEKW
eukprot:CAMPEP_0117421662 /NCGR_PEP_ID=MMETSP0758-20121206/2689_1 /TAXON_ID=63605 /ORGANISM="Percolomonas cosmopolitus, Strain AE-1 (ATCC 50343)" /LENGTH=161 /DNA_ID=CAMNT_0005203881 /DNA_START=330 /DNA_END=812 /DNA_ORIENTATION=+